MDKVLVQFKKADGAVEDVELVTYLISLDGSKQYIVYTRGETQGDDHIIYISRIDKQGEDKVLNDITNPEEWQDVLHLLKKIANVKREETSYGN